MAQHMEHTSISPTPLPTNSKSITTLETTTIPKTEAEKENLKEQMGFNYNQVIWGIIYPMI
jgi:hypothetical protein